MRRLRSPDGGGMWKAIAAIATAATAIVTLFAALLTLLATQTNVDVPIIPGGGNADPDPTTVVGPIAPDPGDAQPTSLEGLWFYDGGDLDLFYEGAEDSAVFYSFDDYNEAGDWIGEGTMAIDTDEGIVVMIGYDDLCSEYEAFLTIEDSFSMYGTITCLDNGEGGEIELFR